MPGDDITDPFLWDVDRVVQELCTSNRSWKAPSAKKLPDPVALEAKLRECEVDGEALLTYGEELGFHELWHYLGINKLPHQLSLKDAITQFQKRSQRYRQWKAERRTESEGEEASDEEPTLKAELSSATSPKVSISAPPASSSKAMNNSTLQNASDRAGLSPVDRSAPVSEPVTTEPPAKKRRIAPITISTEPTRTCPAPIPTQGGVLLSKSSSAITLETNFPFPGTSGLPDESFILVNSRNANNADDDFNFQHIGLKVPGYRRIQVYRNFKRFLLSNSRPGFQARQLSEDVVLPPFGESDDDQSVDTETWEEYLKEEEERKRRRERLAKDEHTLSQDQVRDCINQVLQELEARWQEEKKPKYELKARKIWQDARRNPKRLEFLKHLKSEVERLESRLQRLIKEILLQQWKVQENVHQKFADYLEVTLFEKLHLAWKIEVIESLRAPPKPLPLPRSFRKPKQEKIVVDDDEEEILTSDSDMDHFIEYDEDGEFPPTEDMKSLATEMDIDSPPPLDHGPVSISPNLEDSAIVEAPVKEDAQPRPAPATSLSPERKIVEVPPSAQATPTKVKAGKVQAPVTPKNLIPTQAEVIEISSSASPEKSRDLGELPGFTDLESLKKIGEMGYELWEGNNDADRLVVAILNNAWSSEQRTALAKAVVGQDSDQVWQEFMEPFVTKLGVSSHPSSSQSAPSSLVLELAKLFDAYISVTAKRIPKPNVRSITLARMQREVEKFTNFCVLLNKVLPLFTQIFARTPTKNIRIVVKSPAGKTPNKEATTNIEDPIAAAEAEIKELEAEAEEESSIKKRRRPKRRDQAAEDLRKRTFLHEEELSQRAKQLREKLAQSGEVPSDKSRLIVNESKESDEQALIYINDHIGSKIKDHQIEGVRFMWNQVVLNSSVRQGCLLAHTMGLGKTMQVITLLVVIAESANSPDESIRSQIPEDLRESKTLILCPPGLVDNWCDEIKMWAPNDILGPVRKVESRLSVNERQRTVKAWAENGGVLVMGYAMFTLMMDIKEDDKDKDAKQEVADLLRDTPNMVVCDEAHYIKNSSSQRSQAASNFRTMSRIAMTGSPLTNNVDDYYAMINWVAPNYLGDSREFQDRFSIPIKEGLYADSSDAQKRKARKMLQVLKKTVEPKVHRRDIEVIRNELPTKKEFIITLPLTAVQMKLYEEYLGWVVHADFSDTMKGNVLAKAWSLVARLSLILAHPFVFKTWLEEQKKKASDKLKQNEKVGDSSRGDDEDEEKALIVPEPPSEVLSNMLAKVAIRDIEDYDKSNKILVLLRILDECKKVGDKVLVFSQSIPTLDFIENIMKRKKIEFQRLDGSTDRSKRQENVKRFNTDPNSMVYLISTRAGGEGLNIYGANRVVIFDFKYTPANEQQAIGRAYRLGQTKPVYVYWLTIGGTFEDIIHNNAIFKSQLAQRVVDDKNPDPRSNRNTRAYFAPPKVPEQEDLSGALGHDLVLDAILKDEVVGHLVKKVTSTETFEKEETYELSAEDQQEVEQSVRMERLRIENPEEWKRLEHERLWQARINLGMVPPPFGQQASATASGESNSKSSKQSTSKGNQGKFKVRIQVPDHLREKRLPQARQSFQSPSRNPAQVRQGSPLGAPTVATQASSVGHANTLGCLPVPNLAVANAVIAHQQQEIPLNELPLVQSTSFNETFGQQEFMMQQQKFVHQQFNQLTVPSYSTSNYATPMVYDVRSCERRPISAPSSLGDFGAVSSSRYYNPPVRGTSVPPAGQQHHVGQPAAEQQHSTSNSSAAEPFPDARRVGPRYH